MFELLFIGVLYEIRIRPKWPVHVFYQVISSGQSTSRGLPIQSVDVMLVVSEIIRLMMHAYVFFLILC